MSEISIKTVCCTCLSTDRKLYQLCRILDGINLLYMLLTHDPEAYKDGFYKDTPSLFVCWECNAIMHRIKKFQTQACIAQKHLTSIADGRNDVKLQTFSRLTITQIITPQFEFKSIDSITENFIDCGPVKEIKTESDSDDLPLSVFCYENDSEDCDEPGNSNVVSGTSNFGSGTSNFELDIDTKPGKEPQSGNLNNAFKVESPKPGNIINVPKKESTDLGIILMPVKPVKHHIDASELNNQRVYKKRGSDEADKLVKLNVTSKKKTKMKYVKYFTILTLNEEELLKNMEKKDLCKDAVLICDKCKLDFRTRNELINHNIDFHEEKGNLCKCDICHSYTEELHAHKQTHYQCYNCVLCTHTAYSHTDIVRHLKRNHKEICKGMKKGSKPKQNGLRLKELSKYPCPECDLCFQNKDLRWKHIQKAHREGYKCSSCDKKFAFKNNLERHERTHQGPQPREECTTCHKMIRIDLVKVHSRIHADRQKHTCVECDKSFVSRATYESHLKYAQAHATVEVCRHKCLLCHKRYRSRGELTDHVNYQHKGRADHKCPICGKGLATKRCIRRHVRRAHEGIRESAKDKICQQCGKAFRDKKGLIEHERVHTGARPLSCSTCGRAFRQRAALYAHTRRLHRAQTTISS